MRPDEFFIDDDFVAGIGIPGRHLDVDLIDRLRREGLPDRDDIEVAVPLARLIHDELEKFGTSGAVEMTEEQMRVALRSLRAVIERLGIVIGEIPFRDFGTFRSWWLRNGASGSWQARRDLLQNVFEPLHDQLAVILRRNPLRRRSWIPSAHGLAPVGPRLTRRSVSSAGISRTHAQLRTIDPSG